MIFGSVENLTNKDWNSIGIEVEFYDSEGKFIDETSGLSKSIPSTSREYHSEPCRFQDVANLIALVALNFDGPIFERSAYPASFLNGFFEGVFLLHRNPYEIFRDRSPASAPSGSLPHHIHAATTFLFLALRRSTRLLSIHRSYFLFGKPSSLQPSKRVGAQISTSAFYRDLFLLFAHAELERVHFPQMPLGIPSFPSKCISAFS